MGCAGSKQSGRCRHCQAAYSPSPVTRRSFSLHNHPLPLGEVDAGSHHGVAVTSTADEEEVEVGSTTATRLLSPQAANGLIPCRAYLDHKRDDKEFEIGVIEAKAWSQMIDEKIPKVLPKTPVMTPPGEPETINAWELMEGLEDDTLSSLLRVHHRLSPEHYRSRSFSFHNNSTILSDFDTDHPPKATVPPPLAKPADMNKEDDDRSGNVSINNPLWMDASTVSSDKDGLITKTIVSDFDPEVIAAFRKALEELSPQNPFRLDKCLDPYQHLEEEKKGNDIGFESEADDDDNKENESHSTAVTEAQVGKKIIGVTEHMTNDEQHQMSKNQSRQKAVLYFTSLRGVRKTYEDCCNVRMILKGLGIRIDERDVSMHSGFKEELKELLSDGYHCDLFGKGGLVLPRLFIGNKYIGGAEEIRRMHEEGQLEKVLQCCDKVDYYNDGPSAGVCEACGDIRFVPCETCSGSCKIYYEAEEEDDVCSKGKEEEEDHEYGFQRCPDCNENGLIRCPICCS